MAESSQHADPPAGEVVDVRIRRSELENIASRTGLEIQGSRGDTIIVSRDGQGSDLYKAIVARQPGLRASPATRAEAQKQKARPPAAAAPVENGKQAAEDEGSGEDEEEEDEEEEDDEEDDDDGSGGEEEEEEEEEKARSPSPPPAGAQPAKKPKQSAKKPEPKRKRGTAAQPKKAQANGAAPEDFDEAAEADAGPPDEEALSWKHRVLLAKGPVYFERQLLRQCFKHAVNNLEERELLTVDNLDAAAIELGELALQRVQGQEGLHPVAWFDRVHGDYSTKAVHNALSKLGYRLERFREAERDNAILPRQTLGKFLVRVVYGARDTSGRWATHVIALNADNCRLLDSCSRGPIPLTERNFKAKTGPNKRYPHTRISRVYRLVRITRTPAADGAKRKRRRRRKRAKDTFVSATAC